MVPSTSTDSSCYTASGARSSASKSNETDNRKEGTAVVAASRLYHAIALMIIASALAFTAGTLCRNISLGKNSGLSSSGHQPSVPTPLQSTDNDDDDNDDESVNWDGQDHQNLVNSYVGDEDGSDASPRLPSGQSIFVDISHADTTLLDSKERVVSAMIELFNETNDVFLSYHCHSFQPLGLSCVGISVESHVTVHTWPKQGVAFMNIFTDIDEPLIPSILPTMQMMFDIPSLNLSTNARMQWSYKLRGFRAEISPEYSIHQNPYEMELALDYLTYITYAKTPLVSEETEFQQVDIYEVLKSIESYERSLADDGSYESLHADMYKPDKVLFLDGVQQSSLRGEAVYHEALVHPAMIAHPNPERVMIIGGGEGATLREVLKHKTVNEVTMVDIDGRLIELCRDYLPEWSDCSDLIGSDANSCFDDSRASVEFKDAFGWFITSYGGEERKEKKFDVIIMDALDPDDFIAIVGNLYNDSRFVESLFNGLSDNGVFVAQTGEADKLSTPAPEMGPDIDKARFFGSLQNAGFESMHTYDEGRSYFFSPWSYLVCFKDYESRADWYRTGPELAVELRRRLYGTKSGKPTLQYVDASTLIGYQLPSKAQETNFCRREDKAAECAVYYRRYNSTSDVEVQKSTLGDFAGRGLIAVRDIPANSSLFKHENMKSFFVLPLTWYIITSMQEKAAAYHIHFIDMQLSSIETFISGYGFISTLLGRLHHIIDSGIGLFCNHGCNGTYNYGSHEFVGNMKMTELNVDEIDDDPPEAVFSPVRERHIRQYLSAGDYTLREIKEGEEILCNYVDFIDDPDDWEDELAELRDQCTGSTMGEIYKYEHRDDFPEDQ